MRIHGFVSPSGTQNIGKPQSIEKFFENLATPIPPSNYLAPMQGIEPIATS